MDVLLTKNLQNSLSWQNEILSFLIQSDTEIKDEDYLKQLNLSPQKLLCMDKAVLWSSKPKIFTGADPCNHFRKKVFNNFNLPKSQSRENQKNYRVIVENRDNKRNIENIEEVANLLKHYNLNYTLADSSPGDNLKKQIDLVADIDIYIIVNDFRKMNTMFMPHSSVLIEIFPYGYQKKKEYMVAESCGIFYESVYSRIKSNSPVLFDADWWKYCENRESISINSTCNSIITNADVYVPMRELEELIKMGLRK